MNKDFIARLCRKFAAIAIHYARKTYDLNKKMYDKSEARYTAWFNSLSMNSKRAEIISKLLGCKFRFVGLKENGITLWYAQFIDGKKKTLGFIPIVVASTVSNTKDDAAFKLVRTAAPHLDKSLNELILLDAIKNGGI